MARLDAYLVVAYVSINEPAMLPLSPDLTRSMKSEKNIVSSLWKNANMIGRNSSRALALLPSLLALLVTILPFTQAAATAANDTKRIVQYYGLQYAPGSAGKIHIKGLVTNPDGIYVTNVLFGGWGLHANKTITLNSFMTVNNDSLDWVFDEIKTVQKAGIPVSMWLRNGFEFLENNATFEAFYAPIHDTIKARSLDGVDLDIEDAQAARGISLDGVVRLVRRLRQDFGAKFIITLAPVASALMKDGGNDSRFSYVALEKQCGSDIDWYNAQFYEGWASLAKPDDYEHVVSDGLFAPPRFVVGMTTTPDFEHEQWVNLTQVASTLKVLAKKYPKLSGLAGFDYYDGKPGGYEKPWMWAEWAAKQLGVADNNTTLTE
jgi:hypothetical protein